MIDQQDILSELANVQKDPHIARSSILSRLLAYLVEQSLSNARKGLNSYAVAVDGLGRTADFDPQTDSYARVQVARLRRALDAHYVGPGKDRPVRISIEPRSYEARLVPNEDCLPQAPDDGASLGSDRLRTSGRRARQGGIAAILIGLVVLAYVTYARQQAKDLANWQTSNFPTLAVEIEGYGNNADPANAMLRDRFLGSLAKYEGIRVNYSRKWTNDFRLQVRTRQLPDSTSVDLTLIDEKTGRLLWSQAGATYRRRHSRSSIPPERSIPTRADESLRPVPPTAVGCASWGNCRPSRTLPTTHWQAAPKAGTAQRQTTPSRQHSGDGACWINPSAN